MLRTFKMNVWLLFLLLLLSQNALADKAVIFPASQSVLSQERIGSIIADFFAEKCELSHEYVESALRENTDNIRFGLLGYGYISDAQNTPVWEAYFQLHGGNHHILLDSEGTVLFWQSHNTEHHKDELDVWENMIPATPLETDATEDQILFDVKEKLKTIEKCSENEIDRFNYKICFAYEYHFNKGQIPIWLTYIYDNNNLVYKQANGYNGSFMCINKSRSDFGEYKTDLPSFGDTMGFPYSVWRDNTLSIEEKATQSNLWRPIVEQWLKDYPYSQADLGVVYDIIIRQTYGIPDENSITQQEAEQIAKNYASHLDISDRFIEKRYCRANYLITNPEKPIWRITVSEPSISIDEAKKYRGVDESIFKKYVVEIEALTGEIVYSTIVDSNTPAYMWQY